MATDLPDVPKSWSDIVDKILKAIIAITTTIGMLLAAWNNQKAANIQEHQAVNAAKVDSVVTKIDDVKSKTDEVKKTTTAIQAKVDK